MIITKLLLMLGLVTILQGCVKHINYNDPNLTLNNFTEQMAKNLSSPHMPGKLLDECTYSIPVRMQFSSRSSPLLNPINEIIMEYGKFCRYNKGGKMASVNDNKNTYACLDGKGSKIFSVNFDSRPEEEFYLKTTGHSYRNGNIFMTTILSVDKEIKEDSDKFINKAKIQPRVIDESEYYENETLVESRLVLNKPLLCSTKRDYLEYSVDISKKEDFRSKYVISWDPLPTDIKFSKNIFHSEPKIVVKKRIFNRLYPGAKIFNDSSLEFKVLALSLKYPWAGVALQADFEIKNKTNTYIDLKALSLHLCNRIFNSSNLLEYQNKGRRGNDLTKEATLPPNSKTKLRLDFISESQGEPNGNIFDDQNRIVIDKKTAKNISLQLSVSAKLAVGGSQSTFFKTNRYTLADILLPR